MGRTEYTKQRDLRRQDVLRRIVLGLLVLVTILVAALLSGCATDPYQWYPKQYSSLPPVIHHVSDSFELARICGAKPGTVAGCAFRDYTKGVCDIYLDGDWILPHEEKHCLGYDHAAFNQPPYIQVTR